MLHWELYAEQLQVYGFDISQLVETHRLKRLVEVQQIITLKPSMQGVDRLALDLLEVKLDKLVWFFGCQHKLVGPIMVFVQVIPKVIADHTLGQRDPSAFCHVFNLIKVLLT